ERLYSFHVAVGGRSSGQDQRVVDVFFGTRPLDSSGPSVNEEVGASLSYYRQDDGTVEVSVRPAKVSSVTLETIPVYTIEIVRTTHHLTGTQILNRHLRYLLAMMEMSTIDGSPTLVDRYLVFSLTKEKRKNRRWIGNMRTALSQ